VHLIINQPTTSKNNIAIGREANCATTYQGDNNIFLGYRTGMPTGNYTASVAIGGYTDIQASNYIHFGSAVGGFNLGVVSSGIGCTVSDIWPVYINGVLRKIMLSC